jgi:ribosomal-protein-alanine N-acetyltransferase
VKVDLSTEQHQVHLLTKRYLLRTLEPADASDTWLGWLRDPEVMSPLNELPWDITHEGLQDYIMAFDNRKRYLFGIFDISTEAHVGIYEIETRERHRTAAFTVLIGDKSHWGRDVVLETRVCLLNYFFEQRGIEKAIGKPLVRNFPMIYNYVAQGWQMEGILRGHCRSAFGGQRVDQYQFGLLRSEWRAKGKSGT